MDGWAQIEAPHAYLLRMMRNLAFEKLRRAKIARFEQLTLAEDFDVIDESPDAFRVISGREQLSRLDAAQGPSRALSPRLRHAAHRGAIAARDLLPLQGELFHVQGMDLDARHIWVTSVDTREHKGYIHQFDRRSGRFQRRLEITDGVRYHPGGMAMHGGSIWVPLAECKANSSAVLVEIDKNTLTVRRRIAVADHLGCVAVSGRGLVAGNWDSRLLYVFDRRGRQVRVVANPSPTRYQDMKFEQGRLVGSGARGPRAGAIDWLAWPSLKLMDSRNTGATDRGVRYTEEGMTLKGRDLYLVPEDGPSRMFRFKLTGR